MKSHNVLVTGASGAVGTVLCEHLQSRGWNVIAWTQLDVDLRDDEAVARAFDALTEPLHAVIHTVGGIVAGRSLSESTTVDFDTMVDLNLRSTFYVMQYAMPLLAGTGGAIVTIGAHAALHPAPMKALYAATKAGVHALTLAAAEEGRTHGIRAVCLAPYIIDTPANRDWSTPEERQSWVHPLTMATEIERLIAPSSDITGIVISMP